MNFTEENEELRQNLLNLLNSNDEANVAVGANILWDLSIPDDWVFFLFEKAHRSPSITSLLRKHFPEKEFESAHIWFSIYKSEEWKMVKNLYHLSQLPTLHSTFTWEKLLKSFVVPIDYPYLRGGTMADVDFEEKLFSSPYVPKRELIPLRIDKRNILSFDVTKIPPDVGEFSEIKGIITPNPIYQVPYTLLKMNNLHFLDLGGIGKNSLDMLRMGNKSFVEVVKKFNPQLLVNLELSCWIERNKYKPNEPKEDIVPFLQEMKADAKLFKLVQAMEYVSNDLENEALVLLQELYEQENFYETPIGSSFEYMLVPFKKSHACSYFIITKFQNYHYQARGETIYMKDIFEYYLEYFQNQCYEYAFGISFKASKQPFLNVFCQDMFLMFAVRAYLKMNKETYIYDVFMQELNSLLHNIFIEYEQNRITKSEVVNIVSDILYSFRKSRNPQNIEAFVAKYKPYLPTL